MFHFSILLFSLSLIFYVFQQFEPIEIDSKRLLQRNRNVQAVLDSKQAVESQRIFSEIKKNLTSNLLSTLKSKDIYQPSMSRVSVTSSLGGRKMINERQNEIWDKSESKSESKSEGESKRPAQTFDEMSFLPPRHFLDEGKEFEVTEKRFEVEVEVEDDQADQKSYEHEGKGFESKREEIKKEALESGITEMLERSQENVLEHYYRNRNEEDLSNIGKSQNIPKSECKENDEYEDENDFYEEEYSANVEKDGKEVSMNEVNITRNDVNYGEASDENKCKSEDEIIAKDDNKEKISDNDNTDDGDDNHHSKNDNYDGTYDDDKDNDDNNHINEINNDNDDNDGDGDRKNNDNNYIEDMNDNDNTINDMNNNNTINDMNNNNHTNDHHNNNDDDSDNDDNNNNNNNDDDDNINIDGDGDGREDNYEEEDRSHPQNNDFESLNPEQN